MRVLVSKSKRLTLLGSALVLAAACGRSDPPGTDTAASVRAIVQAPADVARIRVLVAASRSSTHLFDVTPGQRTEFELAGLPVGTAVFSGEAFGAPCTSADFSRPTYLSDAVPVVLRPGHNGQVLLVMRAAAGITVVVDFPGDERGDWVSPDGSPPGTPVELKLDPAASSEQATVFEVLVHGFFLKQRLGPDGSCTPRSRCPAPARSARRASRCCRRCSTIWRWSPARRRSPSPPRWSRRPTCRTSCPGRSPRPRWTTSRARRSGSSATTRSTWAARCTPPRSPAPCTPRGRRWDRSWARRCRRTSPSGTPTARPSR